MAPSWELLLTSLSQFEHRFNAKVTKNYSSLVCWPSTHSRGFSNKMIPQHVACMILTHLPMITWDHDLTIIARHRAQPRWPLLLATNSRLRHLALAAMKDSGIGLLVNSDKIAPKMQNILCLYPASLKSIEHSKQHSTSSTKLSSKPRVSDENIWKHSIELCLLATATHVLRSYAAMQQAFSAVLPWNKHIFESLVWQKDHMICHLLGAIWPNKSRPGILTHLIWFILTYDDLYMSSVHRFLMHLWIVLPFELSAPQLPPALDERACHPFVCRSP